MYPHYVDENNHETNVNNIDNLETNDTKCHVDNIEEQWSSVYEIDNYTPKVVVSKG
jgi:hypothetical protein